MRVNILFALMGLLLFLSCRSQTSSEDVYFMRYAPFFESSFLEGYLLFDEFFGMGYFRDGDTFDCESEIDIPLPFDLNVSPSSFWFHHLMDLSSRYPADKNGGRMAITHLAIYDALAQFNRSALKFANINELNSADSESECTILLEWIVSSFAIAEIFQYYYYREAQPLTDSILNILICHTMAKNCRGKTEISTISMLGSCIGQQYVDYAREDRTNDIWSGEVPKGPGKWTGSPSPRDPMKGRWKPFILSSGDQFRPGPPPDFEADMEELRRFNKEKGRSNIAEKWMKDPVWDLILDSLIASHLDQKDNLWASWVSAAFHVGRYEATIAAWDAKYTYWGIRPFQYDPDFVPLLGSTPNFPGYPAGHTAVAGALSRILASIFPDNSTYFYELANECSEARLEGGVHFRTDNEVKLEMGFQVGDLVLHRFLQLLKK